MIPAAQIFAATLAALSGVPVVMVGVRQPNPGYGTALGVVLGLAAFFGGLALVASLTVGAS